jgi:hypothetical protein
VLPSNASPTDAGRRVAWGILWRRLLSAPPLAADLADALQRAEAIPIPTPAPKTVGRFPDVCETSGRPAPVNAIKPARAHDSTAVHSGIEGGCADGHE